MPSNDPVYKFNMNDLINKNQYKFGLTDHQMARLTPILDEMDRNARAYGWEIGNGQLLTGVITMSEENPFKDPNWRDNVADYIEEKWSNDARNDAVVRPESGE